MKDDFEMICAKFPQTTNKINIYPLGDLHIGSENFSYELWNRWKNAVLNDEDGYVVIIGDMVDNGLKNSKTNSYTASMRPREQKEWLKNELYELSDRIIGACKGNHEERSVVSGDDCPLYDVMDSLGLADKYRENMAFVKVSLGYKSSVRQYSYNLVLAHGGGRAKTDKYSYVIDGMDIFITGHTHSPSTQFPAKIVIDSRNEKVTMGDVIHVVVPSFQKSGGYTLRDMYLPQQDARRIPILTLKGYMKGVEIKWI